jgi:hypothetical protein
MVLNVKLGVILLVRMPFKEFGPATPSKFTASKYCCDAALKV